MQKLKEKYGGKIKAKTGIKMSELMKSGGWNPLAGLLANFIQMPIFSALYYAINRTEDSHIFVLWVNLGHAIHIIYYRLCGVNDIYSDESFNRILHLENKYRC